MRYYIYGLWIYYNSNISVRGIAPNTNNSEEDIMGNTHLEPETKDKLKAYMKETDCRTASRGVDSLLAEHRELAALRRENELLRRII